ncbi:MAG: hypothetical protein OXG74_00675 [Acidobacteria bacterium]|nr:hypothetical protein [Acidobacteriota bacterium]
MKATSVTGATNTQRWPLKRHPSSTLIRTSALPRLKNQSRPDSDEAQMPDFASPISPAGVS